MKTNKLTKTILFAMMMFVTSITYAQTRILDEVFPNVTVQNNITYGWNWSIFQTAEDATGTAFGGLTQYVDSLRFDVYTPTGDTSTSRPVILLSSAGSYLPSSVNGGLYGTKRDSALVELCTQFAKRGFVAIAFEYRLGWNPQSPQQVVRTSTIVQAVYKAAHDAKALIRFLKANAATYGINTNQIILGGSNSGAYHALLAGNLNRPVELSVAKFLDGSFNPMIDTTLWGNFDGANGALSNYNTPGQSSAFQMVLSLGGCVGDTSWVNAGEVPVVAFHGVADGGSPYNTGIVLTGVGGVPIIEVSGPGDYMPLVVGYGNNGPITTPAPCPQGPSNISGNYPFSGAGFEPWNWYSSAPTNNPNATKSRALAYIDTIMNYAAPRIYRLFVNSNYDCTVVGIANTSSDVNMEMFPNPAHTNVTVKLNDQSIAIKNVTLYNISGQAVREHNFADANMIQIDRNNLDAGFYFVNVQLSNGESVKRKLLFE